MYAQNPSNQILEAGETSSRAYKINEVSKNYLIPIATRLSDRTDEMSQVKSELPKVNGSLLPIRASIIGDSRCYSSLVRARRLMARNVNTVYSSLWLMVAEGAFLHRSGGFRRNGKKEKKVKELWQWSWPLKINRRPDKNVAGLCRVPR